jgi:hypothetical protein
MSSNDHVDKEGARMISPPRLNSHRVALAALILLLQLAVPRQSSALQLRWSGGSTALDFSTNTRVVLRVQADSSEGVLPEWWKLISVSDSSGIHIVAPDSLTACQVDTAKVASVDAPSTPADSAANQTTAHLCSSESIRATVAFYTIDLVAGSKGRLKVVALSPADPDSVVESNEVVYNGGVEGNFPPTLLRTTSNHATASLEVTAVGAGLADVDSVTVGAADRLWSVPLVVQSKSPRRLTASADVPAKLPSAVVKVVSPSGIGVEDLPADNSSALVVVSATSDTILYRDPDPGVYCHDFAFYYNSVPNPTDPAHPWKGAFHLFYIRVKIANSADSIIAHAWCDTLGAPWKVDLNAFRPSGVGWDKMKVWAPSIQQIGNLTYMFYTGVDALGNQSIGYATTPMLGTTNISWTRNQTPVYRAGNTVWADSVGHETGRISFRDAFIMPDPDVVKYPGRYLLFNAGEDGALFPHYAIGVARNRAGTLNQWDDGGKFFATDHTHMPFITGALESPLVVRDSLTGAWRMFVSNAHYDSLGRKSTYFLTQVPGDSVTNTAAAAWPALDSLYFYTGNDASVLGWQASEHLQIGPVHFFASYVGPDGIGITRMHWDPVAQKFFFVHPTNAGVGDQPDGSNLRFYLTAFRPRGDLVRFALESAGVIAPKLVIYDLLGRRVRNLSDGRATQGRREFTWDCRKDDGERVSTGMYFARLSGSNRAMVIRVPIVR